MSVRLHIDFETFSEADLKEVGAYRYAADPSTEILCMAISMDDGDPVLWTNPKYVFTPEQMVNNDRALELLDYARDEETLVYAHNAQFEIAVSKYRMLLDLGCDPPQLKQWRCTMAMARRAALPASLRDCALALGLGEQKDPEGSRLIRLLCMPQTAGKLKGKRVFPADKMGDFLALGRYCLQDNRVEKLIHKTLHAFEMKGDTLRTWNLDSVLNDRGVPVNVLALRRAKKIIAECQADYGEEFKRLTGFMHTQRDRVLEWFKERGYPEDDMQATTVEKTLKDWADKTINTDTRRALELKQLLSYAAVAKVESMLNCECGDSLVRGTLVYYGAGPGRWSARLIQPQNFKRPTMKDTDIAYKMICDGCTREDLELVFGNPLEVIASCIRHFIQLREGQMMYDADYAGIEARIVCWLAGQEDALQRFRDNVDSYIDMASVIFGKPKDKITKDERWMGKNTVLGCGFQMGVQKFFDQCVEKAEQYGIKGIVVTREIAEKSVAAFRQQYHLVADLWYACDRAARQAILHPGKKFWAGPKLCFAVVNSSGIPFLVMKLPSGRNIVYPHPKLEPDSEFPGKTNITFYGQLPKTVNWGRVKTYGGKLVENATQGTAADIMANGAANAVDLGFDLLTLIHDQALAGASDRPGHGIKDFCKALEDIPAWADGLPIKADGKVVPYYLKL